MTTHTKERPARKIPNKAARLAALLPLYRAGLLDTYTLQYIADIIGGHRSTILRAIRDLPTVDALERHYAARLGTGPRRKVKKMTKKPNRA